MLCALRGMQSNVLRIARRRVATLQAACLNKVNGMVSTSPRGRPAGGAFEGSKPVLRNVP